MANFFECIKTRQEPVSPVRIEHRTVTACHLTNISLRLGRRLTWDPQAEQIVGDDEANAWQTREQRALHDRHVTVEASKGGFAVLNQNGDSSEHQSPLIDTDAPISED